MVQDAKQVAVNPSDQHAVSRWRESNRALLNSVGLVRKAVQIDPEVPPMPDLNSLHLSKGKEKVFRPRRSSVHNNGGKRIRVYFYSVASFRADRHALQLFH